MKTPMPSSIAVGVYDIRVKHLDVSDAEKNYGTFDSQRLEIKLRPAFASSVQMADTLLHEVIHSLWHFSNLDPKMGEERIVATLSTQLCGVFRANKQFTAWLLEALHAPGPK